MKNTTYRSCWKTDDIPNCIFACKNKAGIHCCSIDEITHTRWYGCVPQKIINKKSEELKELSEFCPDCGAPLTYYHDTERTRAVCSKKCQGWKVVMEIDHET